MGNIKPKGETELFRETTYGKKKLSWLYVGAIIDILATLGVSILFAYSNRFSNMLYFYLILFLLLVIVVLGGELIGVYFGAREQYFYDKQQKKVLNIDE